MEEENIIRKIIPANGEFPGNPSVPLTLYRSVVDPGGEDPARAMEKTFHQNGWSESWRNGIFSYHHYHSNTHEVIGVYSGNVKVMFGGPDGPVFEASAGDVILIPAGVSHKNLDSSADFRCVGAYPSGNHPDMNYGKSGEGPVTPEKVQRDPVTGEPYE